MTTENVLTLESRAITPTEARAAIAWARSLRGDKWALYLRSLWETGLRPGEVLELTIDNVSSDHIRIQRFKKKGHPWDQVPIQPGLALSLRIYAQKAKIKKGRLFPDTIQAAWKMLQEVKHHAKLRPHITLHSFRHGFAYNMLSQQQDQPAVALPLLQRWLGHDNINTTARYIRPTYDSLREAAKELKF